jgi:multicomponent Na+:H+ antiporter subunit D
MVVGILGAVAQSDIKRLLSFTLVSHIGYLLFGVGLATQLGLASAIFYVVHHITIQTTLFLATGLIERRGGSTALDKLGGLARLSPVLAGLFFIPALNLAGIPPFSGFIGKAGLLQAGAEEGGVLAWALVGGGAVTSLLTLYAIARVWNLAFWRKPSAALALVPASGSAGSRSDADSSGEARLPRLMVASTLALVAFGVGLTVVAGPLFSVSDQAAEFLIERTGYVQAVRPEDP